MAPRCSCVEHSSGHLQACKLVWQLPVTCLPVSPPPCLSLLPLICAVVCARLRCVCLHREDIYDLLLPGSGPLNIREDIRRGVYVEGLCERVVEDGESVMCVWLQLTHNALTGKHSCIRKIAKSTNMTDPCHLCPVCCCARRASSRSVGRTRRAACWHCQPPGCCHRAQCSVIAQPRHLHVPHREPP